MGYIIHGMGVTDPEEAKKTFERIKREELGYHEITPETGELKEQITYGVNNIRRTAIGPYIGNWMIQANIKNAMSQINLFKDLRGTKGKVSEGGVVRPYGISKLDERLDCIYLVDPYTNLPVVTTYQEFKGRVSSPTGSVSIVHTSEIAAAGSLFDFEFRFLKGQLKESDVMDALAIAQTIGLGSAKSLGMGKYRILDAVVLDPEKPRVSAAKEAAKDKKTPIAEEAPAVA